MVREYWENPEVPDEDAQKLRSLCANVRFYQPCFNFYRPGRLD